MKILCFLLIVVCSSWTVISGASLVSSKPRRLSERTSSYQVNRGRPFSIRYPPQFTPNQPGRCPKPRCRRTERKIPIYTGEKCQQYKCVPIKKTNCKTHINCEEGTTMTFTGNRTGIDNCQEIICVKNPEQKKEESKCPKITCDLMEELMSRKKHDECIYRSKFRSGRLICESCPRIEKCRGRKAKKYRCPKCRTANSEKGECTFPSDRMINGCRECPSIKNCGDHISGGVMGYYNNQGVIV